MSQPAQAAALTLVAPSPSALAAHLRLNLRNSPFREVTPVRAGVHRLHLLRSHRGRTTCVVLTRPRAKELVHTEIASYIESFYGWTRRHRHLGGVGLEACEAEGRRNEPVHSILWSPVHNGQYLRVAGAFGEDDQLVAQWRLGPRRSPQAVVGQWVKSGGANCGCRSRKR